MDLGEEYIILHEDFQVKSLGKSLGPHRKQQSAKSKPLHKDEPKEQIKPPTPRPGT